MKVYKLVTVAAMSLLCGCNLTLTMIHTEGTASDVVDETQEASPVVSPDISVPVSAV